MEDDVRIGSDEIASIQNQLQHLKINPYPECKGIIFDDTEKPVDIHQGNNSAQCSHTTPSNVPFLPPTEPVDATTKYLSQQSVPLPHQPNREQHYYSTREVNPNISYVRPDPSFRDGGGSSFINIGPMAQQADREQQPSLQTANMALQFMQAMQQSISQVIDIPFFGYEQVKPDYQFDPIVDDDVFDTLNPQMMTAASAQPTAIDSKTNCDKNENPPVIELPQQSATLTPRAMEELYEALEEYSESYDFKNS